MIKKSIVSAIAGIEKETRAIGRGNQLLWHIPEDLKRFKNLTSGHPIIMGRKTFLSIGHPLPNRTNIVVTRHTDFAVQNPGIIAVSSISAALERAAGAPGGEEIFIIGGGEIYKEALPMTDRLYLTLIDKNTGGDVFFPAYHEFTKQTSSEKKESNGTSFEWLTLERC